MVMPSCLHCTRQVTVLPLVLCSSTSHSWPGDSICGTRSSSVTQLRWVMGGGDTGKPSISVSMWLSQRPVLTSMATAPVLANSRPHRPNPAQSNLLFMFLSLSFPNGARRLRTTTRVARAVRARHTGLPWPPCTVPHCDMNVPRGRPASQGGKISMITAPRYALPPAGIVGTLNPLSILMKRTRSGARIQPLSE
jgi:hypothetical protein